MKLPGIALEVDASSQSNNTPYDEATRYCTWR